MCEDRRRIVGQLRVQEIFLSGGRRSWTILWPEGAVHEEADRFLRRYDGEPGTQRTYPYLMVDHLRRLEREALQLNAVRLRDLQRYMGIVGAAVRMPLGEPWRVGKKPYGAATLGTAASVLDLRRPQDYFHRLWTTAFRTSDLAAVGGTETPS